VAHHLDNVWWDASKQEVCGASNTEAVTSGVGIAECVPDLIAPCQETVPGEYTRACRDGKGEEWKSIREVIQGEMVVVER
jgi:hypothetical protein